MGLFADGEPSIAGELARVLARIGRIAVWGAGQSGVQSGVQRGVESGVQGGVEGAVQKWEKALRSEGLDVLASEGSAVVVERAAP